MSAGGHKTGFGRYYEKQCATLVQNATIRQINGKIYCGWYKQLWCWQSQTKSLLHSESRQLQFKVTYQHEFVYNSHINRKTISKQMLEGYNIESFVTEMVSQCSHTCHRTYFWHAVSMKDLSCTFTMTCHQSAGNWHVVTKLLFTAIFFPKNMSERMIQYSEQT